ncbi:hypothetical protein HPO_15483 [Hyphomonas polymorpha PS728]|uniref:Uncharacterized protein n=1 Tax=Hyphomonas polymorpha PS728 TaxID=1280954 RepID=A0A062VD89_9PROT|nr:hypothetical protein [Hyphomonas polymorpha]KCZ97338.1 hypothetical protein HPO_15483 [Hyphomonas polymorpha PS728]
MIVEGRADSNLDLAFSRRKLLLSGTLVMANQALTGCASEPTHEPLFLSRPSAGNGETVGAVARNLSLSADGDLLAFDGKIINGQSPHELFVYNRATRMCTRYRMPVASGTPDALNILVTPSFSQDGSRLAVAVRRASPNPGMLREIRPSLFQYADIAVFELAGGSARRFGDRRFLHAYPVFSPAGDAVCAMRSRNPVQGGHVETVRAPHNHFVEFNLNDDSVEAFAPVEFASAERFWYAPDGQSVLFNAAPPMSANDAEAAFGRVVLPGVWRVPRGAKAQDLTRAEVPIDFAGRSLDILTGVDREGALFVQTAPPTRSATPTALEFYRISGEHVDLIQSVPGETSTYPCVSANGKVFAWRTVVRSEPDVLKTAFRIITENSNELVLLDEIVSRPQDLDISE